MHVKLSDILTDVEKNKTPDYLSHLFERNLKDLTLSELGSMALPMLSAINKGEPMGKDIVLPLYAAETLMRRAYTSGKPIF